MAAVTADVEILPAALLAVYPYSWSPARDVETPLDEFLKKYPPSMVVDDGTKPWIWVSKALRTTEPHTNDEARDTATAAAASIIDELTAKVKSIDENASIPVRKKKGVQNKKELREEAQEEAKKGILELAKEAKWTMGKWLFFPGPEQVDGLWSRIARSLVSGPLSHTPAMQAKVATEGPEASSTRVICLYLPDIIDEEPAREVLKCLVGEMGIVPTSAKPNIYTCAGLTSKHPSGLRSSVYTPQELIPKPEIEEMKKKYFADLEANGNDGPGAGVKRKVTGKPKPKAAVDSDDEDNPFDAPSSDEEEKKVEKKKSRK